jgi:hypothetical protein
MSCGVPDNPSQCLASAPQHGAEMTRPSINELIRIERSPERRRFYLARHWHGELSLAVSFWVNGILAGLVARAAEYGLMTLAGEDSTPWVEFATELASWTIALGSVTWIYVGV